MERPNLSCIHGFPPLAMRRTWCAPAGRSLAAHKSRPHVAVGTLTPSTVSASLEPAPPKAACRGGRHTCAEPPGGTVRDSATAPPPCEKTACTSPRGVGTRMVAFSSFPGCGAARKRAHPAASGRTPARNRGIRNAGDAHHAVWLGFRGCRVGVRVVFLEGVVVGRAGVVQSRWEKSVFHLSGGDHASNVIVALPPAALIM